MSSLENDKHLLWVPEQMRRRAYEPAMRVDLAA